MAGVLVPFMVMDIRGVLRNSEDPCNNRVSGLPASTPSSAVCSSPSSQNLLLNHIIALSSVQLPHGSHLIQDKIQGLDLPGGPI